MKLFIISGSSLCSLGYALLPARYKGYKYLCTELVGKALSSKVSKVSGLVLGMRYGLAGTILWCAL